MFLKLAGFDEGRQLVFAVLKAKVVNEILSFCVGVLFWNIVDAFEQVIDLFKNLLVALDSAVVEVTLDLGGGALGLSAVESFSSLYF